MGQSSGRQRAIYALGVVLCILGQGGGRPAAAQGIDTTGFAEQVLSLLNQARASNGLQPLQEVAPLDGSAQAYSEAMMQATAGGAVFLSHTGPDGSSFEDRINGSGYTGWTDIGENIAAGQKSPEEVVGDWMNSPGHRANILDPSFQDIGIGIAEGPGTWPNGYKDPSVIWWTTDFGGRGSAALVTPSGSTTTSTTGTQPTTGSATSSTTGTAPAAGSTSTSSSGTSPTTGSTTPPSGTSPPGSTTTPPAGTSGSTVSTTTTGSGTAAGASPPSNSPPPANPQPASSGGSPSNTGSTSSTSGTTAATAPGTLSPSPSPSVVLQPAPPTVMRPLWVTAFGARGDGVTDDREAIQAAIDTAQPGDGIYFPTGTYWLGGPLIIRQEMISLWGDGASSVLVHGTHTGIQAGAPDSPAGGILVQSLQFTGIPGKYQADGNDGVAVELLNAVGATVQYCLFTGSGSAVQVTGPAGSAAGSRIVNCRVQGWGGSALVLSGGQTVDQCTLLQDDPDQDGSRSGSAITLIPGSSQVQVARTTVQNARGAGVELQGDASQAATTAIDLNQLTIANCRTGIQIDSSSSGMPQISGVTIQNCSIAGTQGGAGIAVKQGQEIQLLDNLIDGGGAGVTLGVWGPNEIGSSITDVKVNGNTIRNCDRGVWAAASSGGSFARIDLSGNSFSNCRTMFDLMGVPGY